MKDVTKVLLVATVLTLPALPALYFHWKDPLVWAAVFGRFAGTTTAVILFGAGVRLAIRGVRAAVQKTRDARRRLWQL